jgi:hypothetical protein
MQIISVELHTRQQTVAMLNVERGEVIEKTLQHEGDSVREFYSTLAGPIRVGIEATICSSIPRALPRLCGTPLTCCARTRRSQY